jgi:hypothetical protein
MQRSTRVRATGCLLLIAAAASSGQARVNRQQAGGLISVTEGPSLRSQVRPAVGKAPAEVRIEVWIATDAQNRTLEIEVGSDDFYRSSAIALDGAQAARSFRVEYRAIPAGEYEVLVRLLAQKGGVRAVERLTFQVAP